MKNLFLQMITVEQVVQSIIIALSLALTFAIMYPITLFTFNVLIPKILLIIS